MIMKRMTRQHMSTLKTHMAKESINLDLRLKKWMKQLILLQERKKWFDNSKE